MRTALRLLGSRYGIALVLIVLVLAVVGVMRGVAGSNRETLGTPVEPSFPASYGPSAADDGVVADDGSASSPAPPSTSPGAAVPVTVAKDFMAGWLHHDGTTSAQWLAGFARYATASLRDKLKDTDPSGVPAERVTGDVTLTDRAATFVEADVPVDSGTVRLRLLSTGGRWLVDGVDWDRV